MVCTEVLLVSFLSANPNVVTDAFILLRNLALTERGRIIGLASCGKWPLIRFAFVVTHYLSSGGLELRQNMARHKTTYCANRASQTDEAT